MKFHQHPIFKVLVPESVPGIDSKILNPENTWKDTIAYEQQVKALARRFVENFKQFHYVPLEMMEASPAFE